MNIKNFAPSQKLLKNINLNYKIGVKVCRFVSKVIFQILDEFP